MLSLLPAITLCRPLFWSAAVLILGASSVSAQSTLIPFGSPWRYLDNGSNQGTAWQGSGYDDTAWPLGAAELGYGDGDETTVVGYGGNASAKFITTYFRHTLTIADVGSLVSLLLELERDDGAVVYLNGTEVARRNLPAGTLTHTTLATSAIEDTVDAITLPPAGLVDGKNTLAVEIHQAAATSSDISFNVRLTAQELTAQAISPADAAADLSDPVELTVTALHPESSPLAITFQGRQVLPVAVEAWSVIQSVGGVASGTQTSATWTGLEPGASYQWRAQVTAGTSVVTTPARTLTLAPLSPDAPMAHPQTVATQEDSPMAITLSGTSLDDAPLTYAIVSAPVHGTLSGTPPELLYTPASNFHGSDSFSFRVDDGGASAPAAVGITVTPVNDPPNAVDFSLPTESELATPLTLTGSDVDGDALTYSVVTPPARGTLTGTPPTLVYQSSPGYTGPDSFTYVALDGQSTSADATVTLSVATPTLDTLIPAGAVWKFLDTGSNQGTAWRAPDFNDASWAQGPAQLGYGDSDESTVVSYGPSTTSRYITTYFRREFQVPNPLVLGPLKLDLLRDDGAVVYLNGTEILRSNMPTGTVSSTTLASSSLGAPEENTYTSVTLDPTLLATGRNVLAVEIHQGAANSSDLSFDLHLYESPPAGLTRGPYLQLAGPDRTTVRWRTDTPTTSVVRFGPAVDALNSTAGDATPKTEHVVTLTGLSPDTTYYYSIGNAAGTLAGGTDYFFVTHPVAGTEKPYRLWVLGDPGTGDANQRAVRDRFYALNGTRRLDGVLVLGDTVYESGTDTEFQTKFFEIYPTLMRQTAFWPTFGNHEAISANSTTQSGPYFDAFTLPKNGEAGGLPSGTEAYYSFDLGNIHVVCLDSEGTSRSSSGVMANWLRQDLAATTQEWVVAFWHHPAYCRGTRDSDNATTDSGRLRDMREIFVPILEDYGVDLVLFGHEHSYQRSKLIDGHYGVSSTFNPATMLKQGGFGDPARDAAYIKPAGSHNGAVYAVAGSSGKLSGGTLNHPIMVSNFSELGSMILDVDGRELNARFLNSSGVVRDSFTVIHNTLPQALPATFAGAEDAGLDLALSATDAENDALVYEIINPPLHGSLSGTAPNLRYTPATDFHGDDSFSFRVSDQTGASAPATISLVIVPVNDPPTALAATIGTMEDTLTPISLTGADADDDALLLVVTRPPQHGSLVGEWPQLTYFPEENYAGPDDFSFVVTDGSLASAETAVLIDVTPVNDPPVALAAAVTTDVDAPVDVALIATDPDSSALTFALAAPPTRGSVIIIDSLARYQPDPGVQGIDTFSVIAHDGMEPSAPVTITITVGSSAPPPTAIAQSLRIDEDTPLAVILSGTDAGGGALTFEVVTPPAHGSLSGAPPDLTYTPEANWSGEDAFTFVARSGPLVSTPAQVTLTVDPVNDPPLAASQAVGTPEDQALSVGLAGSDVENDPLVFQITAPPVHGTLSGTPPNMIYTPAQNYHGPDAFAFTANDGTSASAVAGAVALTVTPVNDPPVVTPSLAVTTTIETPVDVTLQATDVDGDPITYLIVTNPLSGSLTGSGATRVYTPAAAFTGQESATWRASDGQDSSTDGEISITVSRSGTWEVVVIAGEPAPGLAPSVFAPLAATGGLDAVGQAALRATATDGSTSKAGLWSETSGGLELLVAAGLAAPDVSGAVFGTPAVQPWSAGDGDVLVMAPLQTGIGGVTSANDLGIWLRRAGGPLRLVVRENDPAPGLPAGARISQLGTSYCLQDDGWLTFAGLLRTNSSLGITSANDGVLWSLMGGTASIMLREGSPAPSGAAGELLDTPTTAVIRTNAAGQAAIRGVLKTTAGVTADTKNAVWLWDGIQLNQVMRGSRPAPGTAAGVLFNKAVDHSLTETGLVFAASLLTNSGGVSTSNDTGVWLLKDGAHTLLAREGSQAAGVATGGTYGSLIEAPSMNDETAFTFRNTLRTGGGVTTSINAGVWTQSPHTAGALTLVARKGSAAPQAPVGATFASFDRPLIDGLGRETFTATLTTGKTGVTTSNDRGLWARGTDGRLALVVREGDPMSLSATDHRTVANIALPSSPLSGQSAWGGDGQWLVLVTFTDGSTALLRCRLP